MSRYQMFQEWWSRATSGPSDFRIDKRSAEIGFEAALDIMEKNLTAHNTQSTAIAQIADEMDNLIGEYSTYWTGHLAKLTQWSRQLRAL